MRAADLTRAVSWSLESLLPLLHAPLTSYHGYVALSVFLPAACQVEGRMNKQMDRHHMVVASFGTLLNQDVLRGNGVHRKVQLIGICDRLQSRINFG